MIANYTEHGFEIRAKILPQACTECPFYSYSVNDDSAICEITGTEIKTDGAQDCKRASDCPIIKAQPTTNEWVPVQYHEITEEEREREGYPKEWVYYLDCRLPDDGEEILVFTGKYVTMDINYIDDGYYLDSGYDWLDIIAWMPIPTYEVTND